MPQRRTDLAAMRRVLPTFFTGRDVLEIACGRGWWTQAIAVCARSVVAIDTDPAVLDIARAKPHPASRVRFEVGDAFSPDAIAGRFDGAFSGFWWSHLPHAERDRFLSALHARLRAGSRVVHVDNYSMDGNHAPIAHEVHAALEGQAEGVHVVELEHYWFVSYLTAARGRP